GGLPIERLAHIGEGVIGHDRAVLVLNLVEHGGDFAALEIIDRLGADLRSHEAIEGAGDLIAAFLLSGIPFHELVEHSIDVVPKRRFSSSAGSRPLAASSWCLFALARA